jgi:hypothetical protein
MDKTKIRGLSLTVFYNDGFRHCANGGITEFHEAVFLVGTCDRTNDDGLKPFTHGYIEVNGDMPVNAVVLEKRAPTGRVIFNLIPYSAFVDGKHYMFSGNFAGTSDGRLNMAIREMGGDFYGALAVHDRTEKQ